MKVLANDGISNSGIEKLLNNGIDIKNITVEQGQLIDYINKNEITVLLVRSATKVRKDIIDNCPSLKIIGRGGVGMDNIDVEYAKEKGIKVINTPAASSGSVAELVIAHLYTCARFLHISNRNMPLEGDSNFKKLKKAFAKGVELRGKTLGIIGFGRIGQEVAKIALGIGMNVIYYDLHNDKVNLKLEFFDRQILNFKLEKSSFKNVLSQSDFITLHVPAQKEYVIGDKEFDLMKDGIGLINAARGGVVDEVALDKNISDGKVSFAALDTFENEPNPEIKLLMNPKISLTPHIGAATNEAQDRIGVELADQIIEILK
ncbi:D-2-hydroxyacid dehydrogenase [Flavobacteriaceae bacterium]|jgi:D-3-phosphoglycerate dehydrogenase|nr:D-2-hydroxyacid dehydrogenase [Flavobacteriaceae bacterium]